MYFVNCYKRSNVKEVIRAVLNLIFLFFLQKDFTHIKIKKAVFLCV